MKSISKNLLNPNLGDRVFYCFDSEQAAMCRGESGRRSNVGVGDIYPAVIVNFGNRRRETFANLVVFHDGEEKCPLRLYSVPWKPPVINVDGEGVASPHSYFYANEWKPS